MAIVEDIDEIRNGLQTLINSASGFECLHTFNSAMQAIEFLPKLKIDVVLMDINMPGIKGVEAVKRLKPAMPDTQFMMCTVYEEDNYIFDSLQAGATGYILKNTPPEQLLAAITEVTNGGSPMTGSIARKVIIAFQPKNNIAPENDLSPREKEIVDALAKGLRYKEIADRCNVSLDTVRSHVRNIYKKLQVQSRTEALNAVYGKNKS